MNAYFTGKFGWGSHPPHHFLQVHLDYIAAHCSKTAFLSMQENVNFGDRLITRTVSIRLLITVDC
jgi:hypothetical protein